MTPSMISEIEIYSWKKPFITAILFLSIVLLLNDIAIRLYLYSAYPFIDIPFHFAGGFGSGLVSIALLRITFVGEKYRKNPQLVYTVLMVLLVGIIWEFAEVYYGVSVAFGGDFWFDTYKDLLMDTLGGILSYICFHPHKTKSLI